MEEAAPSFQGLPLLWGSLASGRLVTGEVRDTSLPVATTCLHTLLVGETGFYMLPVFSLLADGLVLKALLVGQETCTAAASLVYSLK